MRTLFILRGAPASGKSTWIKENHLEAYTISADEIRLLLQSPVYSISGNLQITQRNDRRVWETLMDMVELRMKRGEFLVIDATHYKSELIGKYKKLIKEYRYRAFIVDFTDVKKEEVLKRNETRDPYKRVPVEAIEKMYAVFDNEDFAKQIPNYIKILTRDEAVQKLNEEPLYDFNEFEKIVVIPDLHGCFEPVDNYFKDHPFNEKYMYVFLGDYIDRGIQNKEVLEFLISIMKNKNVLLLEGNHERHLRTYCSKEEKEELTKGDIELLSKYVYGSVLSDLKRSVYSPEFKINTIPQIETIDKADLRQLCDRFGQFAYFKYHDKVYCLTHGGIPTKPSIFMSTREMIFGVGEYAEIEDCYKAWNKNTPENYIQLHGHRNVYEIAPKYDDRNYNLNSDVEYGKDLRIAEIDENGVSILYYENTKFNPRDIKRDIIYVHTENELYKSLNECKFVTKKELDNDIISYNFSRNAFDKGVWNNITVKARGLFISKKDQKVVCRSYDKFFNVNEVQDTELRNLKESLEFPVTYYRKYNGYLGLISFYNGELFVASKSTNKGEYADNLRRIFNNLPTKGLIEEYLSKNDVTCIFEVIDPVNDPHIIEYKEEQLVLLDIVKNELNGCHKLKYDDLKALSRFWCIECKEIEGNILDKGDFMRFYNDVSQNYSITHEGWVFEDKNGFMFKFKTPFYKFWKYMRSMKDAIVKGRNIRQTFVTADETKVISFMRTIDLEELDKMSIIDVRKKYLERMKDESK